MRTIKVSFEVSVPENISDTEAKNWIEYNLYKTSLSTKNPLVNVDLEATRHSVMVRA